MRAALLLLLALDAGAYVRSRTKHGTAVFWPGSCVFIQPDSDGSPDLAPEAVFATVQKSMQNWQTVTTCAYIRLNYDAPAKLEAHLDGKNVVKFRTDRWCHPDDAQDHGICYDRNAAAITTVFYLDRPGDSQDGFIIDADVELNDVNFTFVNVVEGQPLPSPSPGKSLADLENTLTHELGHLQGLDHTCKDAATPDNEVDENGKPPPACNDLGSLLPAEKAKIQEATMFNSAMPGETKKRTPEADDIAGICAIYPLAAAAQHPVCKETNLEDYQTSGCQFAPGPAGLSGLLLLGLLGLVRRPRRHKSGRPMG
jgi:MYXO-CTERM domain-containing protein